MCELHEEYLCAAAAQFTFSRIDLMTVIAAISEIGTIGRSHKGNSEPEGEIF